MPGNEPLLSESGVLPLWYSVWENATESLRNISFSATSAFRPSPSFARYRMSKEKNMLYTTRFYFHF